MGYTQVARTHTHTETHTYVHKHVRVCGRVGTENACADTDALCALFKSIKSFRCNNAHVLYLGDSNEINFTITYIQYIYI